ncbi:PTS sugar transporter subunit IIA [Fervidibacillus albus]|uniref:PTS sugar transporter subunit IIA n=1 Tax=Fervidibacillus albus TaxID=2980026 RepID=A0A9E8RVC1_9BACI|nr:PTS sugar transporter subunit IIA [Fervidibacillus albus]WAA09301.1 PTS sugar transporter subunit IIA [Fervidibacillus albus]
MDFTDLFNAELIRIDMDWTSKEDFFREICNKLFESGYIEETFEEAIMKREASYPTGLATEKMNISIPHTDVVHVKKPFIFVIKLANSLPFIHMGTTDHEIEVDYVFMLGIKEPSKQVHLLSLIMDKIQDENFIQTIESIKDVNEMENYLKNTFRSDEQ